MTKNYPIKNLLEISSMTYSNVTLTDNVFTLPTGGLGMINQILDTPDPTHKYYGRCLQKTPAGYTFADGRFEYYNSDIAGTGLLVFGTLADTGGEWQMISSIQQLTGTPQSGTWQLRSFSVNGSSEALRKEMLIVDLTETFGQGNEPTKEWCDANIPYIDSNTKIVNMLSPINGNSGFNNGVSSTEHTKYADSSLRLDGNTNDIEVTAVSLNSYALNPAHTYYACVEIFQEEVIGSSDFYFPIAEPVFYSGKTAQAGKWIRISNVNNRSSFSAGNYQFRLDFNNAFNNGSMWFDGLMLIDLTETFGEGNEPSKEWCDTHLPFFTGTKEEFTLNYNSFMVLNNVSEIYLGESEVNKILLGEILVYEKVVKTGLPCYCKSITHDSSCSGVIDTTATEVFYMPDGRIVISFITNTTPTSYLYVDDGHTLLPGVSAEYSNKIFSSGDNGLIVLTGVTKPFNISVTASGNYIKIAMTEATGVSKYISKLYVQSLTFTGSYASSSYFTESACGIGYSENGKVAILMKNGTTTSYENISFSEYTMLPGVTLSSQTSAASTNNSTNRYYIGILEGLNVDCDIQILMGQRSSGSDYVGANIIMSE